jgi:fumarate reductase subunit D
MPAWLMRVAIGCATTIMSFVAMILLFILTLYLACGACEPDYNSSASSYFILVLAAPLFLLASIILGVVVGYRVKPHAKIQNGPLPK